MKKVFIKKTPDIIIKECLNYAEQKTALYMANTFLTQDREDFVESCAYEYEGHRYFVKTTKAGNLSVSILNRKYK